METKVVYAVDRGTRFPVMATWVDADEVVTTTQPKQTLTEKKILRSIGYEKSPYKIVLYDFRTRTSMPSHTMWPDRTLRLVHQRLVQEWPSIKSGADVVVSNLE